MINFLRLYALPLISLASPAAIFFFQVISAHLYAMLSSRFANAYVATLPPRLIYDRNISLRPRAIFKHQAYIARSIFPKSPSLKQEAYRAPAISSPKLLLALYHQQKSDAGDVAWR